MTRKQFYWHNVSYGYVHLLTPEEAMGTGFILLTESTAKKWIAEGDVELVPFDPEYLK